MVASERQVSGEAGDCTERASGEGQQELAAFAKRVTTKTTTTTFIYKNKSYKGRFGSLDEEDSARGRR